SAQMHHENIVRSAVWLPAALLCLERSLFRVPRSAVFWSALGALAFAQAALGLHVQPVLIAALALGLYAVFRAIVPTRTAAHGPHPHRLRRVAGGLLAGWHVRRSRPRRRPAGGGAVAGAWRVGARVVAARRGGLRLRQCVRAAAGQPGERDLPVLLPPVGCD